MKRPDKLSTTICNKLEKYCDFLESQVETQEKEKDSLASKVEKLSMELTTEKLKQNDSPCNNFISFKVSCSHCRTPVCKYCGGCTNPKCRLFNCGGN